MGKYQNAAVYNEKKICGMIPFHVSSDYHHMFHCITMKEKLQSGGPPG